MPSVCQRSKIQNIYMHIHACERGSINQTHSFVWPKPFGLSVKIQPETPEFGTILRNLPSMLSPDSRTEEGHICPRSGLFKDGPHRGNPLQ